MKSGKIKAPNLVKWLEKVEEMWEKIRGEKAKRMSIYERLDYQHNLTNQNPSAKFIVVYTASGTHLASCVVNNEYWVKESKLEKPVIIEHALWRYSTNNVCEAYYLTSILNSNILDNLLKPMQTKGFTGVGRGFEKKPLEFPIPKFNEKNDIHAQLAELGKEATRKAYDILPKVLRNRGYDKVLKEKGVLAPTQVANLRSAIREELSDLLSEIDRLVADILLVSKNNPHLTLDKFGIV